jgi:hypothetical protein
MGTVGKHSGTPHAYNTSLFIVPSGGTYRVDKTRTNTFTAFNEAKMPLAVGTGGDSIWSDVDGDAVLETDGKKLTIDANVAELGAKARISTDTNLLEFNVGSGGLPDMIVNDGFVKLQRDGQEININPSYSDTGNAIIESNDPIGLMSGNKLGLLVGTDGKVTIPTGNVDITKVVTAEKFVSTTGATTADAPNVHMTAGGSIIKSTTATYSAEEVDARLAIKDKLIEKLSARLDKLEKKVK